MPHPSLERWEKQLKGLLDRVNDHLEREHAGLFPLHPRRPPHGATSDREQDGLFAVGVSFSLGLGSSTGPGYVLRFRLATLERVAQPVRDGILEEAVQLLRAGLSEVFPDRSLQVVRDGDVFRIYGDLSLGRL